MSRSLVDLPRGAVAIIAAVLQRPGNDPVGERLVELGFAPGETVSLVARGPFAGDPIAVAIGGTRFALRHAEAARIQLVSNGAGQP